MKTFPKAGAAVSAIALLLGACGDPASAPAPTNAPAATTGTPVTPSQAPAPGQAPAPAPTHSVPTASPTPTAPAPTPSTQTNTTAMSTEPPPATELKAPPFSAQDALPVEKSDGVCYYSSTVPVWAGEMKFYRADGYPLSAFERAPSARTSKAACEAERELPDSALDAGDVQHVRSEFDNVNKFYGLSSTLKFYDDCKGANAGMIASTGEMIVGKRLLAMLKDVKPGSWMPLDVVLAHEQGHRAQYLNQLHDMSRGSRTAAATQLIELGADALAGYYIYATTTNNRHYAEAETAALMNFMATLGTFDSTSSDWHGTPQQRQAALAAGVATARETAAGYTEARVVPLYSSIVAKLRHIIADPDCYGTPSGTR